MPIALIFIAAVLVIAAVNDQLGALGTQANAALFGPPGKGFLLWMAAIVIVSSLFKAIDLGGVGKALVVLVIVSFVLQEKNGGLFTSIVDQISQGAGALPTMAQGGMGPDQAATPAAPPATPGSPTK